MFHRDIRQWPTEQVSGRVLMVLIVLSVMVFGAFFLVGFDMPFEEDANFNAPLLTDLLLVFTYLLIALAVVVCVVSVVRGIRTSDTTERVSNGVPTARITRGTVALLFLSLVLTFVFGSSEPMKINGDTFDDTFWLKVTDMFINTSIILMLVAVAAVAYGLSKELRNKN